MSRLDDVRDSCQARYDLSHASERKRSVHDTVELLHALGRQVRPTLTLEVGAFSAYFSRRCVVELPEATVIALEANPYNWNHHVADLTAAGVNYWHLAATREDGPVTFRVQSRVKDTAMEPISGENSLMARKRSGVEYEEVTVIGRSLDHLLADHGLSGQPSMMWVDVEGAQREVIAGGMRTFRDAALVLIEVETKAYWAGQMLEEEVNERLGWCDLEPVWMDFEYPFQHNVLYVNRRLLESDAFVSTIENWAHEPAV